ncbi:hydantoin racemase [Arthrobacter sp. Sa2BUA2]|uniref:Hydantoin racemase n=1 Tax=Arthrobacter pullicola TaxID=2762224 RepID=A0ABR8YL90_9MICC|nr:aspartate/glutamate racemase family protein [Arthrobacter pullicola]MBD8045013.1 hydantoin racemase [Arthrobacter pullicola]
MGTRPVTPGGAKVLLVNPNTNQATTNLMAGIAADILRPRGLEVVGLTAAAGPQMILDPDSLAESAHHVQDAVFGYLQGTDAQNVRAVVVAAIGDPGRQALQEALEIPVIGIGQASILSACGAGRSFGMATSTPLLAGSLAALVEEHGCGQWFTGVRLTESAPLVLAADPERQFLELAEAVREASQDDGAESVIIAGGPLSETARRLSRTGMARIVEPVPSACAQVLQDVAPGADAAQGYLSR